jgi:hypothetical protein
MTLQHGGGFFKGARRGSCERSATFPRRSTRVPQRRGRFLVQSSFGARGRGTILCRVSG